MPTQLACNHVGQKRLVELVERYGLSGLNNATE